MSALADRLSPDLVCVLAKHGEVLKLAQGKVLINEGDASQSLFVLVSGKLKVFSRDHRGREVILSTLQPGDILGEMFLDGGRRSASVKAFTDVECLEIRESTVTELLKSYPELSGVLVFKLIRRLRHATTQIKSLAFDSVFVRTIAAINTMSVTQGGMRFLPAAVSQKHIADSIGATREMVNHVFRDLLRGELLIRDEKLGLVIPKSLPERW